MNVKSKFKPINIYELAKIRRKYKEPPADIVANGQALTIQQFYQLAIAPDHVIAMSYGADYGEPSIARAQEIKRKALELIAYYDGMTIKEGITHDRTRNQEVHQSA